MVELLRSLRCLVSATIHISIIITIVAVVNGVNEVMETEFVYVSRLSIKWYKSFVTDTILCCTVQCWTSCLVGLEPRMRQGGTRQGKARQGKARQG